MKFVMNHVFFNYLPNLPDLIPVKPLCVPDKPEQRFADDWEIFIRFMPKEDFLDN